MPQAELWSDEEIVELYWKRSEDAIRVTDLKYRRMLKSVSFSLLRSAEDSEECLNDTYLAAWNAMPTDRPGFLGAYLSKIIRRLSVSRYRASHREKRGGVGNVTEELTECIPDSLTLAEEYDNSRLAEALNGFLRGLSEEKRAMFVRRYFSSEAIDEIAAALGVSESKVKTTLFRLRGELKVLLEREELM